MATRSTIAVELEDGKVQQVYAHWDGYLEHNGAILLEHYNTQELAIALTNLGSISSLRERITPLGTTHSFDSPEDDVTIYYGRDRGERDTEPHKFENVEEYKGALDGEEYDYLFSLGKWTVRFYKTQGQWIDLQEALAAVIEVEEA